MTNRILSCPFPENINPLSPNGYMFNIQRLPKVSYFAQEVNLPTLALGTTQQSTPFSQAIVAGDILEYSPLTVQFLVDEKMENYKSIHSWLVGLGFPENHDQYQNFLDSSSLSGSDLKKSYSDATLTILGNTNTPIQTIQFIDLLPESLDSITFVSNSQDVQYLVGSATFRYSYYKFV
jgi:hypothetical protein